MRMSFMRGGSPAGFTGLLVLVLTSAATQYTVAQTDTLSAGATMLRDGATAVQGVTHIWTSPLRWQTGDWLMAGGICGGTVLASAGDVRVREAMARNQSALGDHLEEVVVLYGDGLYVFPAVGGAYLAGLLLHDRWLRETAMLAGTAVLASSGISTLAKVTAGRARPYAEVGNRSFTPFRISEAHNSFPSGHTIVSFSLSGVLARRIDNIWASIGLYALATLTSVSRLYSDQHWFSDVVFSAATALQVSSSVVSWYEGSPAASSPVQVSAAGGRVVVVLVL